MGVPQHGWFLVEQSIKIDDFRGTPILGNLQMEILRGQSSINLGGFSSKPGDWLPDGKSTLTLQTSIVFFCDWGGCGFQFSALFLDLDGHLDRIIYWLAVWNMFFFFHILGIIIPTDFHSIIFQRGRSVYHQPDANKKPITPSCGSQSVSMKCAS